MIPYRLFTWCILKKFQSFSYEMDGKFLEHDVICAFGIIYPQ
jgi:hypothetical protein